MHYWTRPLDRAGLSHRDYGITHTFHFRRFSPQDLVLVYAELILSVQGAMFFIINACCFTIRPLKGLYSPVYVLYCCPFYFENDMFVHGAYTFVCTAENSYAFRVVSSFAFAFLKIATPQDPVFTCAALNFCCPRHAMCAVCAHVFTFVDLRVLYDLIVLLLLCSRQRSVCFRVPQDCHTTRQCDRRRSPRTPNLPSVRQSSHRAQAGDLSQRKYVDCGIFVSHVLFSREHMKRLCRVGSYLCRLSWRFLFGG